jgi:hypothetical protein
MLTASTMCAASRHPIDSLLEIEDRYTTVGAVPR